MQCCIILWTSYPTLTESEIAVMSRDEYFARINASELKSERARYEAARISLDNRTLNNAVIQDSKDDVGTFAITTPEQIVDIAYIEGLFLADEQARPTDIAKLLREQQSNTQQEEVSIKESNLSRYRKIANEMYTSDD